MKIHVIKADGKGLTLPLPNALLFSSTAIQLVLKANSSTPEIPPATAERICAVLQSWKETHGSWELIHVESASGDIVSITV